MITTNDSLRRMAFYFRVGFWLRPLAVALVAVAVALPASGITNTGVIAGSVAAVVMVFVADLLRSRALRAEPFGQYAFHMGETHRACLFRFPILVFAWLLPAWILTIFVLNSGDALGWAAVLAIYVLPFVTALYEASRLRDAHCVAVVFRDESATELTRTTMKYMWVTFYIFSLAFGLTAIAGCTQNEIDEFMLIVSTPVLIPAVLLFIRSLGSYAAAVRMLESAAVEDTDIETWARLGEERERPA